MYHGIVIDQEFSDPAFIEKLKVFARKQDGNWGIYGIEVAEGDLEKTIKETQMIMKSDQNWYTHFYSDTEMLVVFKNKIFKVTPHASSWSEIITFGKELNIPEEQLDFWPNRFQDEIHYFAKVDFKI